MEVKLLGEKRTLLVRLTGEIDHHVSAKIKDEIDGKLCSTNAINIVFDFSELKFMDSSGIGMIMGRYKKVRTLGGRIIAFGVDAQILRIMEMSGIDKIIRLAPAFEKAMYLLDK